MFWVVYIIALVLILAVFRGVVINKYGDDKSSSRVSIRQTPDHNVQKNGR